MLPTRCRLESLAVSESRQDCSAVIRLDGQLSRVQTLASDFKMRQALQLFGLLTQRVRGHESFGHSHSPRPTSSSRAAAAGFGELEFFSHLFRGRLGHSEFEGVEHSTNQGFMPILYYGGRQKCVSQTKDYFFLIVVRQKERNADIFKAKS
jgi:hypothetical protein